MIRYIKNMLSNYIVNKYYKNNMNDYKISNQQQIDLLFANNGIDL